MNIVLVCRVVRHNSSYDHFSTIMDGGWRDIPPWIVLKSVTHNPTWNFFLEYFLWVYTSVWTNKIFLLNGHYKFLNVNYNKSSSDFTLLKNNKSMFNYSRRNKCNFDFMIMIRIKWRFMITVSFVKQFMLKFNLRKNQCPV